MLSAEPEGEVKARDDVGIIDVLALFGEALTQAWQELAKAVRIQTQSLSDVIGCS